MPVSISANPSTNKEKIWYSFSWGKGKGQRIATGIFTYSKPRTQTEKNHNEEALSILEVKKSQFKLEGQSVGSKYIPSHKIKSNFLDFYQGFVKDNRTYGSRHLSASLNQFKSFIKSDYISARDISRDLCERFRGHLLQKYNGSG